MTPTRTRPLKRVSRIGVSAILLVGILIAVLMAPPTVDGARADDVTAPASLDITGLTPVALGREGVVNVSGSVANTSVTSLTDISVRIVISTVPVPQRSAIGKAPDAEDAYGAIPLYATTTAVIDTLPPGATANYRITTDAAQFPLSTPGVYVIGVEAVGLGPSGYVILDSARTLIPYLPDTPPAVNVTWLWPLATTPGQAPDDVLLGDAIPREIGTGGRLTNLLSAGATSPAISWVVDPQLLQVTAGMADGYLVEQDGEITAGTRSAEASTWISDARQILGPATGSGRDAKAAVPMWVMPYADPDADALVDAELPNDLVRATTDAPRLATDLLQREPDGTLFWAPGGRLERETLEVLASAGVSTVVLRESGVTRDRDIWYTPSGYLDLEASGGRVRALVADPGLLKALSMPQSSGAEIVSARQRFLAELAYVALEPTQETRYLIAAPRGPRWSPNPRLLRAILASLEETPWARLVPVDTVLALPSPSSTRSLDPPEEGARALGPDYLARIATVQGRIEALRTVLTDPLPVIAPLKAAILRAESSAWQSREAEGERLLATIEAAVKAEQDSVYVIPRDTVVFSGDRGSVPVTIANDLDQTVRVGVAVSAEPEARLESAPVAPVDIEPGRRTSLEVPVRVIGSGAVTVSVQLLDPAGTAFGTSASLELSTTAYSRAALWVAIAAGVLLVLLVIFDVARRARQRALVGAEPAP